jgi:glycosyltransferase involved in cell wall biosynthesis
MKTVILHNIISSNTVYKLNSYISKNKKDLGNVVVFFCSETEENRRWNLSEKPKFKFKTLPGISLKIKGKDLFTYFINPSVIKELNSIDPDRIIISGWDQFAYQLAYLWGWIKRKKMTVWSGSTEYEKSWKRVVTCPMVKFFIRIADDYVAYGKRAKDYLVKMGARQEKIAIFLNDVNRQYFTGKARRARKKRGKIKHKLGLNKKYYFIYVGQLIERKGILNLIKAYRKFRKTNNNWGLVIVGYGPLENVISSYVKGEDIKMLGTIEQYDLPEIYTSCDCLVLPSTEEVWGLVVNEAIYCGLKVVVGNVCGCVPDLIKSEKDGYVFRSTSVSSLLLNLRKAARSIEKKQ